MNEMGTKDNRPPGQGSCPGKLQDIVVLRAMLLQILGGLPTIPGELPMITAIFRTTAIEKSLTLHVRG